jgi:hypothetical protein
MCPKEQGRGSLWGAEVSLGLGLIALYVLLVVHLCGHIWGNVVSEDELIVLFGERVHICGR